PDRDRRTRPRPGRGRGAGGRGAPAPPGPRRPPPPRARRRRRRAAAPADRGTGRAPRGPRVVLPLVPAADVGGREQVVDRLVRAVVAGLRRPQIDRPLEPAGREKPPSPARVREGSK